MKNEKRVGFLDEVRGFAIICMVFYHIMFILKYVYKKNVPFLFEDWFYYIWLLFAGSFIFISGIVCRYSKNNLKRGVQCFFLGMIVTFVTAVAAPSFTIMFGILHFLGVSMMIFGLAEGIIDFFPPLVGMIISLFLLVITWNIEDGIIGINAIPWLSFSLPDILYKAKLLFPLGFTGAGFSSGDFFPVLPWLFLFIAGSYFGVYVKRGSCPDFFYRTRVPFLAATGKYTIWIYLLHQPIATLVLRLIFGY